MRKCTGNDRRKKRYLSTTMTIASVVFAVCISLGIGSIGFLTYYDGMIGRYQDYISGIIKMAELEVNADDLRNCIDSGQKSEDYEMTQEFLDKVRNSYDIEYIYMLVPLKKDGRDNMKYVMCGVRKDEINDSDNKTLGDLSGTEYDETVSQYYLNAMQSKSDEIVYYKNRTEFGYMYTGLKALTDSEGKAIAVLAVDISINQMRTEYYHYLKIVIVSSLLLTVIFLFVLKKWMTERIVKPIDRMKQSSESFVKDSRVVTEPDKLKFCDPDVKTSDEMESLSDALIAMSEDLKTYMINLMRESRQKERIESELNVATHIQASMLPCIFPPFPDCQEFDIYAEMTPAREVGGDFYDFFMTDENHIALVAADVSGKGVPAALFMVIGKTLLKDYSGFEKTPAEVFTKVNDLLCESNKEDLFITAFEGILDIRTGEMQFANAGHEKPIIYHKDENKWEVYPTKPGFVLAGIEGIKYCPGTLNFRKGDRIVLYTDGIPEAVNKENEQYGMERFMESLNKYSDSSCMELTKGIKADLECFTEGTEQFDDITVLCFEYKGTEGK